MIVLTADKVSYCSKGVYRGDIGHLYLVHGRIALRSSLGNEME